MSVNIPALRFKDKLDNDFPDWYVVRFEEELVESKLGGNYANSEERTDHPLIKMGNLGRGDINLRKVSYILCSEQIDPNDKIKEGDLFFNTRNTLELVGKVAIWRSELPVAYYNSNLMRINFPCNRFMNYRFNSFGGVKALRRLATGTTSVAAIYTRDLLKMKITLPTLPEQEKIADFLTAVDKRIGQLTRKKALLEDYKKGVMQQIFSQAIRFKDDDGKDFPDWEENEFAAIAEKSSAKHNPSSSDKEWRCVELESLSQNTGKLIKTFSSSEQKSTKNRFVAGEVLFGKLRPYLRKFLHPDFDGVCSSEIWVFRGKTVTNSYLYQLIQTHKFNQAANVSSGSKMPRSDWGFLSLVPFKHPYSTDEQRKIADFLSAIDRQIETVATQITQTQTFKKGLLQGMFV